MIRERLGTGLAAAALGTLVLVMVLVAGWFGVGRPGGLFGPAPSSGGARVVLVNPDLDLPGTPGDPAAPAAPVAPADGPVPPAPPAPESPADLVPTPPAPDSPPPPTSADPGTAPPPAPSAAEADAVVDTVVDTVESVVTLTASTVEGAGSTLDDTVALALGLLTAPADDDAPVTAADVPTAEADDTGETDETGAAGGARAATGPRDPAQRGRGLPTSPSIPALPR